MPLEPAAFPRLRVSSSIMFRNAGEASTATTIAAEPAAANAASGHTPTRRDTSRETPFASTSTSPTLSRVTKVDAIPARLRSMNSTRLKWVPTATISSAPRCVGELERDVLADSGRRHGVEGEAERTSRSEPGARPSA